MMSLLRPRLAFSQNGWFLRFTPLLSLVLALGVGRAHAQRPLGTDVSHWQGTINWTTVKNAGIAFAWAKATESDYYKDAYFTANVNGAKSVGIPIGAYHFARPSSNPNITGANSAETEAAFYWGVVSNYVKAGGSYMVPMLDWEDTGYNKAAGFTNAATASAWVNQWCNTVSNYARANGVIGMKPIVYTGVWISQPNATYPGLTTAVTIWPSWIAAYPSNPNPQTGGPSSSFPWSDWNVWQYADTNWSGGDSDVFHGTLAQMQAMLVIGSGSAPSITSQPSDRFADPGGTLTLRVAAGGAEPLKYQWRLNGANIAGATTNVYTLTNIQAANAGSYTVVVTNTLGRATSSVARLTVNPPFATVYSDNFDANSSANWRLNQSSASNTRLAFAYNYSGYGIPSAPNSVGGTTKGLKLEANYTGAGVAALNISPIGQSFGASCRLHFDMWINANGPFPLGGTGSSQLLTAGVGTDGTRVQWNSGNSDGVFFAIDGEGQATDTSPDIRAQVGITLQDATSGVYVGGTSTSIRRCSDPYYSNVFPGGQTPPAAQGQTGALDVGTVGFGWHDVVVNKSGNVIEWFIDGLKYCSVTNASLTASNVFVGYWDPFSSLSSSTNLSFGLVDNLRVEVPAVPPAIAMQPQPQAVNATSNATFAVTATGAPAPAYQWRFNGADIANATGSSYTRSGVQPADAGSYSVVVSNVAGTVTSTNAILTVYVPPAITTQPQPLAVNATSNAVFTVAATGTPAPGYQWRFNGTNIAAAAGPSLTVTNAQPANAGSYSVVVANIAGAVTSFDALLTVNVPPEIAAQPQSATVAVGSNVTFAVTATGTPAPAYQWRFNGTNIVGATATSYTRANAQYTDAGSYSVLVTNIAGSLPSADAFLSFLTASPAQFQAPLVLADGSLQLVLAGDPGATYYVQSSTDLSDWQPFTNLTLVTGTLTFNAGYITNNRALYFRARSGP